MSFYQRDGGDFQNRQPEDDDKKLFVGGLSWETTKEDLKTYFEQFGDVTYCALKTDPNSGKSRGFGFITFSDESSVLKVVKTHEHHLDKRQIDPKRAKSRSVPEYGPPVKKIFVGGLDPNVLDEEALRNYFGQFGTITEFSHPFDRVKKQKKGFCFVSFEKPDIVHNIVGNKQTSKHDIDGHEVDVRKAMEQQQQGGYQDGWGGQQGGWGGYQQQQGSYGGRGGQGGRGDSYGARSQGGWGGEQGYGGSSYGGSTYGQQSTYDSYGGAQQGGYYSQSGYGNGYGSYE